MSNLLGYILLFYYAIKESLVVKIISRKEAKALGLKRYFTGMPCKNGHVAERYMQPSNCVECQNEKANSDEGRRYRSKYMKVHKDHFNQYGIGALRHVTTPGVYTYMLPDNVVELGRTAVAGDIVRTVDLSYVLEASGKSLTIWTDDAEWRYHPRPTFSFKLALKSRTGWN